MSKQQQYAKQKREKCDTAEIIEDTVGDGELHAKNENDEILDSDSSTKIKIHRKRSIHHTETLNNPLGNIEDSKSSSTNVLKESEKEASEVDKKYDEGSFSDSLEIGVDGEVSSSDKGRGQIARKLTFGHEVMDQYPKGRYRIRNVFCC